MVWALARLLLCVALLAATPARAEPGAAGDPVGEAVASLNAARVGQGLAPVRERTQLSAAARVHIADMVRRGYFNADPPGRAAFRDWFVKTGFVPGATRIIVTAGAPDAALLIETLLDDGPFREILLDRHAGEIGIGHRGAAYRAGREQVTDTWVMVVARTRYDPVPNAVDGLVRAVNRARAARGLAAVMPAQELAAAAMAHARDMVARGYFGHHSPDGQDAGDRARGQNYRYRSVGENLAAGGTDPEDVVRDWTDSPGHAAVMYDPSFREIGVGYLPGPVTEPTRSLGQIWVAVFGTRR
ncbi:CAP domain-containing protein [Thalassobaculum sp.]|uniref:CAP domain-containing protein n=1 Tax=Thalassobaculum sp. TaxID=2022740 RepID=UPI0032ECC579